MSVELIAELTCEALRTKSWACAGVSATNRKCGREIVTVAVWATLTDDAQGTPSGACAGVSAGAPLAIILDELDILGNINIVIFYIYLINKWTYVSISPLYPYFIIKIYIFI